MTFPPRWTPRILGPACGSLGIAVLLVAPAGPIAWGVPAFPPDPDSPTSWVPGAEPISATIPPVYTAEDWPTYMENSARTGANLNESVLAPGNVSDLRVLWNATTPGVIESSPIVVAGVTYVTSWDGSLSAYYLDNGTLKWRTNVGTSTFSQCYYSVARGPTSTPTVANGTIYVMGGDPYFYALNASNGSVLWKVSEQVNHPSSGDYNWGSPLIFGSNAYLGISSACNSPGAQGMVEEINLNGSQHQVTHTFAVVPSGGVLGGVWSAPSFDPATNRVWVSIGDGAVSTTYGQSILALNGTDLSLIGSWQVPINCCDYDFGAGPTLLHDSSGRSLVAALNKDGVVYALNRSNVSTTGWSPIWSDNVSWYANTSQGQAAGPYALAPAAFDGSTLYVGAGYARLPNGTQVGGTVRAIYPSNGTFRWTQPAPGYVRAGLAYANGLILDAAIRPNGFISTLEVRAAVNGTPLFRFAVDGEINGAPTISRGLVLFGTGNWTEKGPGTIWVLGRPLSTSIAGSPQWGAPRPTITFTSDTNGGVPPYRFSWQFGDGSPGSPNASPTHAFEAPGNLTVSLQVVDSANDTANATWHVTIPRSPVIVGVFVAAPSSFPLGGRTDLFVAASGGFGNLTYTYTGLPGGCVSLNVPELPCTPGTTGSFVVEVWVNDTWGDTGNASTGVIVEPPVVSTLSLVAFLASPGSIPLGGATELLFLVTGGSGTLQYGYTSLPPGCLPSDSATILCTPTSTGVFHPTATVTDSAGQHVTASTTLTVTGPPATAPLRLLAFIVSPSTASFGENVTWTVVVDGGIAPYQYTYVGLPSGCVSANRSSITCAPEAAGTFATTVTVMDAAHALANGTVDLHLQPTAQSETPSPLASPSQGVLLLGIAAIAFAVGMVGMWLILRRRGGAKV